MRRKTDATISMAGIGRPNPPRLRSLLAAMAAMALWAAPGQAQERPQSHDPGQGRRYLPVVALLNFESSTLTSNQQEAFAQAVWSEFYRHPLMRVLPREELRHYLLRLDLDPNEPYSPLTPHNRIADALKADYVVTGHINNVGDAYTFDYSVFSARLGVTFSKGNKIQRGSLEEIFLQIPLLSSIMMSQIEDIEKTPAGTSDLGERREGELGARTPRAVTEPPRGGSPAAASRPEIPSAMVPPRPSSRREEAEPQTLIAAPGIVITKPESGRLIRAGDRRTAEAALRPEATPRPEPADRTPGEAVRSRPTVRVSSQSEGPTETDRPMQESDRPEEPDSRIVAPAESGPRSQPDRGPSDTEPTPEPTLEAHDDPPGSPQIENAQGDLVEIPPLIVVRPDVDGTTPTTEGPAPSAAAETTPEPTVEKQTPTPRATPRPTPSGPTPTPINIDDQTPSEVRSRERVTDADHAAARQAYDRSRQHAKNSPERIKLLRNSVALDPEAIVYRKALARAYYEAEDFSKAIEVCHEVIAVGEPDSFVYTLLGSAYFEADKWEEARQAQERALQIDPSNLYSLFNLALALQAQGSPRAIETWSDYLERAEGDPEQQSNFVLAQQYYDSLEDQ